MAQQKPVRIMNWEEIMEIFSIREAEVMQSEEDRLQIVEKVNHWVEEFGRDKVLRCIALNVDAVHGPL